VAGERRQLGRGPDKNNSSGCRTQPLLTLDSAVRRETILAGQLQPRLVPPRRQSAHRKARQGLPAAAAMAQVVAAEAWLDHAHAHVQQSRWSRRGHVPWCF